MTSDTQVSIIPMSAKHWPDVVRIFQQGMDTGLASLETSIPDWDAWDENHLAHSRFVISVDGEIAGWSALSPVSHRCAYEGVAETSIYLDSRFQRKGLGLRLLNHTVESSEENGIWTLQAMILEANRPSIHLHEKAGFRIVGVREKIGRRNKKWIDIVLMERRSRKPEFLS